MLINKLKPYIIKYCIRLGLYLFSIASRLSKPTKKKKTKIKFDFSNINYQKL